MTEGKRNIIQGLLQEYNIESAADIQEALKDLSGGTIKEMMEAEMDEHLGYEKSERSDSDDARNGYIAAAYPQTESQRCIVHQVRNTLKYVSDKDRKAFANDLKMIYNAPSEQEGREALDEVTEKWQEKYPRAMKRWYDNWDAVSPIFKFSKDVRTVIYTTNAIESLNSTYRRLNSQRSVFPSDTALLKALYLSTFEATKKWTMPIHNWGKVYGELAIMYDGRLPD
ncbi:MAG: transposase [Clostridia bacterium]|nr:transposase [Clostridia bacterium]MBR0217597.1 transposase [Clostridia bacterium]MBR0226721.1 transposase [Clostridia bacterium]